METTYTVIGTGTYGPAHPLYNPAVQVIVSKDGKQVATHRAQNGKEGHRWALENGYSLVAGDPRENSPAYQDLKAEVSYHRSGL